jgi:hypothetical protein
MARTQGFVASSRADHSRRVSSRLDIVERQLTSSVLTNAEGRPRGFGTALFGAVEDAARAVSMFNG